MNILFLGPQGSGKGTQAHLLKDKTGMSYLDMGAFLREVAKTNKELNQIMSKGEMIPDQLTIDLLARHLRGNNLYDNLIYDGFPRRIGQLKALLEILEKKGRKIDYTIYISLPEEETVRRLSARRIHKVTGEIYNLLTNPPGPEVNPDDLQQREDDYPDAIRRRLKIFHEETEPMIEDLKELTNFIEIDGTQSIEEIHNDILAKIDLK